MSFVCGGCYTLLQHCIYLHPNCLKYLFQNKTGKTNLSPRKVRNPYSFNFLSVPCPDWIVQMVLTSSRVPEWKNNIPRLNVFSYGTVTAIVQLRLEFTSITSLIYDSHQPLIPQNKPLPVQFHIISHAGLYISMKAKERIQKRTFRVEKLDSPLPWTSFSHHKQWMCHTMCMCIFY